MPRVMSHPNKRYPKAYAERLKRITKQAAAPYRMHPGSISELAWSLCGVRPRELPVTKVIRAADGRFHRVRVFESAEAAAERVRKAKRSPEPEGCNRIVHFVKSRNEGGWNPAH